MAMPAPPRKPTSDEEATTGAGAVTAAGTATGPEADPLDGLAKVVATGKARIPDDAKVVIEPPAPKPDSRLATHLIMEAALFSAGKPLSVEEIAENTGVPKRQVRTALEKLAAYYKEIDSSLEVGKAGARWAMQVRALYAPRTTKLAPMEVSIKTIKTLALIAYHQPLLQSDLMEMVGAKVYDHVKELVALGLIRKRAHERSYMLVTTERFPEYFGIAATDREEIKQYLARKVGLRIPDTDGKGNRKLTTPAAEVVSAEDDDAAEDAVDEDAAGDDSADEDAAGVTGAVDASDADVASASKGVGGAPVPVRNAGTGSAETATGESARPVADAEE